MQLDIDVIIIVSFLAFNLVIGLYFSKNINTFREYAVGDKKFNTFTIAATIVATWISGSSLTIMVGKIYSGGLIFLLVFLGDIISLLILSYIIAPRMKKYLKCLSVAEIMGNLYGKNIRIITSIASLLVSIGSVAMQLKVCSLLFNHFLGVTGIYATLISTLIIIIYSTFGGVKAVIFTDVIQFITFGTFIPALGIFIWKNFGTNELLISTFYEKVIDFKQNFNFNNKDFLGCLMLFIYMAIPTLYPTFIQRMLIAKNEKQIQSSFLISTFVCFCFILISALIAMIMVSINSDLKPDTIIVDIINNYSYKGLKGLTVIGLIAMVMSTVDSYINSAAVIFSNDLCKSFNLSGYFKNDVVLSRLFSIFIGIAGLIMAFSPSDLLGLVLLRANFYMPIITVPLFLTILGFQSSTRTILIGMITGLLTVILWRFFILPSTGIDSVIPGMIANLLGVLITHYSLSEPGGWGNLDDTIKLPRKRITINDFIEHTKSCISFLSIYSKKFYSKMICKNSFLINKKSYIYFSLGVLLNLLTILSLDHATYSNNSFFLNLLQNLILLISSSFICINLWSENFKRKYIDLILFLSIFLTFAFSSILLVLISQFSHLSLVVCILNLAMIGILVSWQASIIMILIGVILAFYIYKWNFSEVILPTTLFELKLKISYIIIATIGFLFGFLKPKQEQEFLKDLKAEYLDHQIHNLEEELIDMLISKEEFLRNIQHESRAPITGTVSIAQTLCDYYEKLPKEVIINNLKIISQSSRRLESWANNLYNLAKFKNLKARLKLQEVNIANLIYNRIEFCRKIYESDKHNLEFVYQVESGIFANVDEHFIKQVIDNLIINALQFNTKGNIIIRLIKEQEELKFSISDEGMGIPQAELYDVFAPFTVSSKTKTPAGGRGIGLTLCKKVIEVHQGMIWADNNLDRGVTFNFTLPLNLKIPNTKKKRFFLNLRFPIIILKNWNIG